MRHASWPRRPAFTYDRRALLQSWTVTCPCLRPARSLPLVNGASPILGRVALELGGPSRRSSQPSPHNVPRVGRGRQVDASGDLRLRGVLPSELIRCIPELRELETLHEVVRRGTTQPRRA